MSKSKDRFERTSTEPTIKTQGEQALKAQGLIYVENPRGGSGGREKKNRTLKVEVPENKLEYYCSKRYKKFQYWFDSVHEEGRGEFDGLVFGKMNAVYAAKNGLDYMFFCAGIAPGRRRELSFVPMLFYEKLSAILEKVVKEQELLMRMNILAANQEYLFDLVTENNVEIREVNQLRVPELCEIYFSGAEQVTPHSLYELFSVMRCTLNKKNKLLTNSYYLIYAEIISKQKKVEKRRILMIDATKDIRCKEKNWDNGICHVLNKCLLGLHNQRQNKESYAPFRDCKITRLLKPFLIYNSRVDVIGFIRREEDENTLIALNLVKNLSRIQVPLKRQNRLRSKEKSDRNNKYAVMKNKSVLNPEISVKEEEEEEEEESDNYYQISSTEQIKHKSCDKPDLSDEVRKNAEAEVVIMKKLHEIRQQIKLMLKKRQMNKISREHIKRQSELLDNLQERQYELKKQQQQVYLEEYSKISQYRIDTINKSSTKLDKLKLLKQYYTIAIKNQNVEIEEFIKIQDIMTNYYQNNIQKIENNLIKSIVVDNASHLHADWTPNKDHRFITVDKSYKHNLPSIINKKRMSFIRDTVRKGRAEYSNFLRKNIQLYQLYPTKNVL